MTSTHSADANQQYLNVALSKVKLVIHHQFPSIELVSPIYACDDTTCYFSPVQKVVVGSTMQVDFNIKFSQREPIGILMYELKNTKKFNNDAMPSEDEERYIRLFMAWKVDSSKKFRVVSLLIEHDKGHIWDRDRLMKLAKYYMLYDIQHGPIELTWLMHDNTVLMTRADVTREAEYYKLEMTISKASIKDDTTRPYYFDVDR
jgi:hypothetical protein